MRCRTLLLSLPGRSAVQDRDGDRPTIPHLQQCEVGPSLVWCRAMIGMIAIEIMVPIAPGDNQREHIQQALKSALKIFEHASAKSLPPLKGKLYDAEERLVGMYRVKLNP